MSPSTNSDRVIGDVSRYDLVLLVIPVAFLLALVTGGLFAIPPQIPLVAAALVGAVAVGDAMFRNPPLEN
jgi:hypothetical protein